MVRNNILFSKILCGLAVLFATMTISQAALTLTLDTGTKTATVSGTQVADSGLFSPGQGWTNGTLSDFFAFTITPGSSIQIDEGGTGSMTVLPNDDGHGLTGLFVDGTAGIAILSNPPLFTTYTYAAGPTPSFSYASLTPANQAILEGAIGTSLTASGFGGGPVDAINIQATPIPEPSMALTLVMSGGLVLLRRKRS